jgi:tetratricopeptide (TPR) repeat protein
MKQMRFAVAVLVSLFGLAATSWAQDQSAPYMQAGNNFYSQKNYDQAIRYYQATVQMNANSWQAYQGLGNCYYAKGDTANALTNYQKALDINPNNPQLSQFVQTIKPQSTAPPLPAGNNNAAANAGSGMAAAGSASSENKFELDINLDLFSYSGQIGFGGGLGGFLPLDKSFAIGAIAGFDTVSEGASASYGGSSVGASASLDFLNFAAAAKYRFDGDSMRPYIIAGLGISDVMSSYSVSAGGVLKALPLLKLTPCSSRAPDWNLRAARA